MTAGDEQPTDRLERALQASLRPVDPGAEFTAALQARIARAELRSLYPPALPSGASSRGTTARSHPRWLYSASLGLAASIAVALAVGWQLQDLRAQRAQQARLEQARIHSQVLLALEITGEGLGLAQQRIEQFQTQERNP